MFSKTVIDALNEQLIMRKGKVLFLPHEAYLLIAEIDDLINSGEIEQGADVDYLNYLKSRIGLENMYYLWDFYKYEVDFLTRDDVVELCERCYIDIE